MYSDDEMETEYEWEDDEEMLGHQAETLEMLRSKKLVVKNHDGSLRCPFSPSRKKQSYAYKDLLQHATGVATGKRGSEAAGKHGALKTYLESDLSFLAVPVVQRPFPIQHEFPRRRQTADLLVFPWSVVVYNLNNSELDFDQKINMPLGKGHLKDFFADFNPEKVHVLWNHTGPLGIGVLHFARGFQGLKDAQSLADSFMENEHGRRDYEKNRVSCGGLGAGFYGWLARREDYQGQPGYDGEISKYLQSYGDLKDFEMMGEEMRKIYDLQVEHLKETVCEKNKEFLNLRAEAEIARRNAELELLEREELHKKELDEIRLKARRCEDEYNQAALNRDRIVQLKEKELLKLEEDLQLKELHLKSAADRAMLDAKRTECIEKRELISKQQELQKQYQNENLKLIQKHEEEKLRMAETVHQMTLLLEKKQQNEMEKQHLHDMLDTELIFNQLTIGEGEGGDREKQEELKNKLQELESNDEFNQETINCLVMRDRVLTDEIADARKVAADVIRDFEEKQLSEDLIREATSSFRKEKGGKVPPLVALKMAGEIDPKPWKPAYQRRFKTKKQDWELEMKVMLSKWEMLLRNSAFQPFKTVQIGEDKWTQEVDHENKDLAELKKSLGDEVYNSVTTALSEIEEYNPSGRYPVPVAWIFEESRRASLKEVIAYLGSVINALTRPLKENSRKRGRP